MYQSRTKRGSIGPSGEIADREGKYWAEKRNNEQRRQILDRDGKYWGARGNIGQRGRYIGQRWKIWDRVGNIGQRTVVKL